MTRNGKTIPLVYIELGGSGTLASAHYVKKCIGMGVRGAGRAQP